MKQIIEFVKKIYKKIILVEKINEDAEKAMNIKERIVDRGGTLKGLFWIQLLMLRRKYNKICMKYNCFIPLSVELGDRINLPHGLCGIFISQNAKIGANCCIFQHVTIGSNNLEGSMNNGAPVIGDNVIIGAGAKVIGGCKIGNNVRIGANAIVCCDIPDNSTVVLEKSRVILHNCLRDNAYRLI